MPPGFYLRNLLADCMTESLVRMHAPSRPLGSAGCEDTLLPFFRIIRFDSQQQTKRPGYSGLILFTRDMHMKSCFDTTDQEHVPLWIVLVDSNA